MSIRGVAQPGRVLGLGPRCRRFEPSHPDHPSSLCFVAMGKIQTAFIAVFIFIVDVPGSALQRSCLGSTMSRFDKHSAIKSLRMPHRNFNSEGTLSPRPSVFALLRRDGKNSNRVYRGFNFYSG